MGRNILQITGTDTAIGKTTVACLLVRALLKKGISCRVFKPVETGCREDENGRLIGEDTAALREACGGRERSEDIAFHLYRSPVAPVVAAEVEGSPIDYPAIVSRIADASRDVEFVLYETAGGPLVPLTETKSYLDLAKDLDAESLLVVGSRLGAINHAALTFHAFGAEGLSCVGYVFNDLFAGKSNNSAEAECLADAITTNRRLLVRVANTYGLREVAALPFLEKSGDGDGMLDSLAEVLVRRLPR